MSPNRTYPQYDNDIIEIVDHTYQPAQGALEQRNENMFAETAVNKSVYPKSTPGPASKKTRPIQIAQKILKPNTEDFISWQKSQNVVEANTRSSRAKARSKMNRDSKVSSSSNFSAAEKRSSAPRHSQTSIQTKVNDVQGIGSRGVKRRSSICDDVVNQVDMKKIKEEDDKSVIQASSFIQALGKPKTSSHFLVSFFKCSWLFYMHANPDFWVLPRIRYLRSSDRCLIAKESIFFYVSGIL